MYQVGTAVRVRAFTQECRNQYVCSALGRPMRMRGGTTSRARPAVREAPDQSCQDEAGAIGDDACIDAMTRRIQQSQVERLSYRAPDWLGGAGGFELANLISKLTFEMSREIPSIPMNSGLYLSGSPIAARRARRDAVGVQGGCWCQ